MAMRRAAIYARYSTDQQSESSIQDQVRVCTEHAKRLGLKIVAKFEDQGISGAALENRPGVMAMQRAALAREFDVLLLMDVSRLSRNQGQLASLVELLVHHGVRVIAVHDGADTDREGWELQFGITGVFSHYTRRQIARKTHAALETRAKAQRPTGGRAYAYVPASQSKSGRVEIEPAEARIVREIFRRYAAGESEYKIACDLNARKVPSLGTKWKRVTRRASGWMDNGIRAMLRNELYSGEVIWNRSVWTKHPTTGKRERRERPESEWIRHVDEALRIVDDATWEAVKARCEATKASAARGIGQGKRRARYLLSGLLRCHACKAHYVLSDGKSYGCSSNLGGGACGNTTRIPRVELEDKLLGTMFADLQDPKLLREQAARIRKSAKAQKPAAPTPNGRTAREIQDLDDKIAKYDGWLKRGHDELSRDEIALLRSKLVEKRKALIELEAAKQPRAADNVVALMPAIIEQLKAKIEGARRGEDTDRVRHELWSIIGAQPITLEPRKNGGLVAHFALQPDVVIRAAGAKRGLIGSGGRI